MSAFKAGPGTVLETISREGPGVELEDLLNIAVPGFRGSRQVFEAINIRII